MNPIVSVLQAGNEQADEQTTAAITPSFYRTGDKDQIAEGRILQMCKEVSRASGEVVSFGQLEL